MYSVILDQVQILLINLVYANFLNIVVHIINHISLLQCAINYGVKAFSQLQLSVNPKGHQKLVSCPLFGLV